MVSVEILISRPLEDKNSKVYRKKAWKRVGGVTSTSSGPEDWPSRQKENQENVKSVTQVEETR